MAFSPVSSQVDFPALEREILKWWNDSGVIRKYLHKNDSSKKRFSFLDGPITANNPMGVHHAWGRTYKDLWQRYHTMKGDAGRYQNGFDCQGLWVEVEVEKELGFKSKKDIETYGVANFVNKCKDRVWKYSAIQTGQSRRLGYFMDWDNSYYTMSDENNYAIWGFLKECWQRGWIYKGHDVVPWCPRCETAISQHEILTEDYKELTHDSVFLALPIKERPNEYLLIWTTTPWTLPANTAVAVDQQLDYVLIDWENGKQVWIAKGTLDRVAPGSEIKKTLPGKKLVGLHYLSPFDDLPIIRSALDKFPDNFHISIATDNLLMPITVEEGTGLVHTSTSTGEEDHKLGKKLGLPVIPAINDSADYLDGFGQFTGQNAKKHPEIIIDYLKNFRGGEYLFRLLSYTHRYPACWRCRSELVWKVADEWYISMDQPDPTDIKQATYRKQMMRYAGKIKWLPGFGRGREMDWLKNMHDWLISKKNRYWGLALPIYECPVCHKFEIIGSKEELQSRAVSGWDKFAGNTPHKPWIDEVKIKCRNCGEIISRIPDVGNPWLDAGVVGVSTLPADWFPADFITESFPGQFKNWFYSLIAMSTVLKKSHPADTVLGFASLLDEKGQVMHKSAGNMIEFSEGADEIGADVMRWMFTLQNPENNLLFGYKKADETRRQFHLMLWNIYNFFVTYANIDDFKPAQKSSSKRNVLDEWILARLKETINTVSGSLDKYNAASASLSIQDFVSDLSLWYIRRSRDRVGPASINQTDKLDCHQTLYTVLVVLCRIMAPFNPFITESIFKNLTGEESVHLSSWPKKSRLTDKEVNLVNEMRAARKIVEMVLSFRKINQIKVRQPLDLLQVYSSQKQVSESVCRLILDEVNMKHLDWINQDGETRIDVDIKITPRLQAEGELRELIRQVQEARKTAGARLDQKIILTAPLPADADFIDELKFRTLAQEIIAGDEIKVRLI